MSSSLLIVVLVAVWLPGRWRFASKAASATPHLDEAADLDLYALRAMANVPLAELAKVSSDPAAAWRAGDTQVIRRLAALELFEREDFPAQVSAIAPVFEQKLHALKGRQHIVDIRNYGLAGALQLAPRNGDPTIRPRDAHMALWEAGFYVRYGGDTLQFGPPFGTTEAELERLFDAVASTLDSLA